MSTKTFNIESRLLAGKLEAPNYGTAQTLENSDIDVRVRDLNLSSLTVEYDDESSKFATGDHTRDEAIAGITTGTMDFYIKLAPGEYEKPNDPLTDPITVYSFNAGKYFQGAGLVEKVIAPTAPGELPKWVFTPSTAGDLQTLSMAIVDKESVSNPYGIEYKIAGAMSTLTIDVEGAGKPYKANFSYTGKVDGVYELHAGNTAGDFGNGAIPVFNDQTINNSIADKMLSTIITIDALNHDGTPVDPTGTSAKHLCVNTFSLDTGLTLAQVKCQEDAAGILYTTVTSRDPKISINPLLERVGDGSSTVSADWLDFWKMVNSESTFHVNIKGNHMEIDIPRGQFTSPNITDDEGFLRNELSLRCLRNIAFASNGYDSAEQDYRITFDGVDKQTGL